MTLTPEQAAAVERLNEYLSFGGEFEQGPEPDGDGYEERSDWRQNHSYEDLWLLANAFTKSATAPRCETCGGTGWLTEYQCTRCPDCQGGR